MDLPLPQSAPDRGGEGARATGAPTAPQLARKAAAFIAEETGIRFEALVLFAEPLFEHYGLDPTDAFALRQEPEGADEGVIAALEAARMIWAYLSLDPGQRRQMQTLLADYLLGPAHAPEDEIDLELLLDRMQEQWAFLSPEERALAEDVPAPTLGFEELLHHPATTHGGEDGEAQGYGPEGHSEVEAQALFAQPLLNAAEDPDEMEFAIERAHAYWELGQLDAGAREARLALLLATLATRRHARANLENEARQMLARFDELFGRRPP